MGYHGLAAAPAVAATHVIAKRDAEADADPAYFYNGYAGYGGYFGGYAGLYAGAYAGYPYAGAYAGYPYAGAYAAAPSDPHLQIWNLHQLPRCTCFLLICWRISTKLKNIFSDHLSTLKYKLI